MQATDAENAAFVVFVVLVTRVILAFDLNLYIPLSKVDENMKRAHSRDAVHKQKVGAAIRPGWRRAEVGVAIIGVALLRPRLSIKGGCSTTATDQPLQLSKLLNTFGPDVYVPL